MAEDASPLDEKRNRLIQVADELRRSSNSINSENSEALKAIAPEYFKEDFRLTPAFFQIKGQENVQEMSEKFAV